MKCDFWRDYLLVLLLVFIWIRLTEKIASQSERYWLLCNGTHVAQCSPSWAQMGLNMDDVTIHSEGGAEEIFYI